MQIERKWNQKEIRPHQRRRGMGGVAASDASGRSVSLVQLQLGVGIFDLKSWPVFGPTSAADAPTQDQVAHIKPDLRPNVPKLCRVGPT